MTVIIDREAVELSAKNAGMDILIDIEESGSTCFGIIGTLNQMVQFFIDFASKQDSVAFQLAQSMRHRVVYDGASAWVFGGFDLEDRDLEDELQEEEVGTYEDVEETD